MTIPIVPSIADEQLMDLERDAEQGMAPASVSVFRALIARLRGAEKDAARYRWISENASIDWKLDYKNIEIVFPVDSDGFDYLDDLVDLAMEQS